MAQERVELQTGRQSNTRPQKYLHKPTSGVPMTTLTAPDCLRPVKISAMLANIGLTMRDSDETATVAWGHIIHYQPRHY